MIEVARYAIAYSLWIVDLGLAFWLAYLSRTGLLGILALFYKKGDWHYAQTVNLTDKFIVIILGLGWLTFMIIVEQYFRSGAAEGDVLRRFGKVTGPVLLCIFVVDLILFWIQGIAATAWLRWLILASELGIGLVMLMSAKTRFASTS
jgi:hypothetical protein